MARRTTIQPGTAAAARLARQFTARAVGCLLSCGSLFLLVVASAVVMACHSAGHGNLQRRSSNTRRPGMVANWDPERRTFVPLPPGSAKQPTGNTPQANVQTATVAPVLQVLPSGKGTFIDLHGASQSYVVIKASNSGGISTTCLDGQGTH